MRTCHSRTGVTFGEIIAILAIISITAAILFPAFQKVHSHSGPSCASSMRLLGLALTQYTQDAGGIFPAGVNAAGNGWAGEIYPYVKSDRFYHCPDDPEEGSYISYAENQGLVRRPFASLTAPDATVALYETTTQNCDPSSLNPPETNSTTGFSAPQNSTRHTDFGLNFLATDGHVKYLKPAMVSSGPGAVKPNKLGTYALTFTVK